MNLEQHIAEVPDFPQKGIAFKDITPLLKDRHAFAVAVHALKDRCADLAVDVIVGIEARGYLLGAPLALLWGVGFVPVRKVGKLPRETYQVDYELEYGLSTIEMHRDGLKVGEQALVIDDVLATGGTMEGTIRLVEQSGATVAGLGVLLELQALRGRDRLEGYRLESILVM